MPKCIAEGYSTSLGIRTKPLLVGNPDVGVVVVAATLVTSGGWAGLTLPTILSHRTSTHIHARHVFSHLISTSAPISPLRLIPYPEKRTYIPHKFIFHPETNQYFALATLLINSDIPVVMETWYRGIFEYRVRVEPVLLPGCTILISLRRRTNC